MHLEDGYLQRRGARQELGSMGAIQAVWSILRDNSYIDASAVLCFLIKLLKSVMEWKLEDSPCLRE